MKTLLKVSGAVGTAWLLYYAGVLVGGGVACAVFDKRDGHRSDDSVNIETYVRWLRHSPKS
jgi:hypothetical protein